MRKDHAQMLETLRNAKWHVSSLTMPEALPSEVLARYPWMPEEYRELAEHMGTIASPDDKAWFLTVSDFSGRTSSAFAWNEWEKQSLEAAGSDAEWVERIRAFWNLHLPIFLSVKSGYAFCAVERSSFSVVCGEEPEYEDVRAMAPSFGDFLAMLVRGDPKLKDIL